MSGRRSQDTPARNSSSARHASCTSLGRPWQYAIRGRFRSGRGRNRSSNERARLRSRGRSCHREALEEHEGGVRRELRALSVARERRDIPPCVPDVVQRGQDHTRDSTSGRRTRLTSSGARAPQASRSGPSRSSNPSPAITTCPCSRLATPRRPAALWSYELAGVRAMGALCLVRRRGTMTRPSKTHFHDAQSHVHVRAGSLGRCTN